MDNLNLTSNELHDKLSLTNINVDDLKVWLEERYFPKITDRLNDLESRKKIGLYKGEKRPKNERNLTDVRTRLGLLFEFEIARISNVLLKENDINDLFWSHVVANRFPDLEVRNSKGELCCRFEIKCLEDVAEEKSANFDTLLKDINHDKDFVVVCLWGWKDKDNTTEMWEESPFVQKFFVFNAYSLALLRDYYWLNNPPKWLKASEKDKKNTKKKGKKKLATENNQGFDIRYAVTCSKAKKNKVVYKRESGNYGKLTRFWTEDINIIPEELNGIKNEYIKFQQELNLSGFRKIASEHLGKGSQETINEVGTIIFKNEKAFILFSGKRFLKQEIKSFVNKYKIKEIVKMNSKYQSSIYNLENGKLVQKEGTSNNIKPKNLEKYLSHHS